MKDLNDSNMGNQFWELQENSTKYKATLDIRLRSFSLSRQQGRTFGHPVVTSQG